METLKLDSNSLERLDSILSHYEKLTFLSVGDNDISEIAANTFFKLWHLTHLDISKNKLSRITRGTFKGLYVLEVRTFWMHCLE